MTTTDTAYDDRANHTPQQDIGEMCRSSWWIFLLTGAAAIIFGILAILNPAITLLVLGLYLAVWLLMDGVINIAGAVRRRSQDGWLFLLFMGILSVLVGGFALLNPPASMVAFVYVVSFMAILLGISLVAMGRRVRTVVEREWVLYLTGGLSILFGALIVLSPSSGALSVVWLVATWALVIGVLRIAFAFYVRKLQKDIGISDEQVPGQSS